MHKDEVSDLPLILFFFLTSRLLYDNHDRITFLNRSMCKPAFPSFSILLTKSVKASPNFVYRAYLLLLLKGELKVKLYYSCRRMKP